MLLTYFESEHTERILRLLCYGFLLTLPLDIYRLDTPGFSLSIPRLFLLGIVTLFIILSINGKIKLYNDLLIVWSLFAIGTVISFIVAIDYNVALPWLIQIFLSLITILAFGSVFRSPEKIYRGLIILLYSYLIYFVFAAITLYNYYILGELLTDIPFRSAIPLPLANGGHLENASRVGGGGVTMPRVALPYTSPPNLAVSYVIALIAAFGLSLLYTDIKQRMALFTLILASGVGIVITFSRTGWVVGVVSVSVLVILSYSVTKDSTHLWYIILSGGVFVIMLLFVIFPVELITGQLVPGSSAQGHVATRRDAVSILLKDWKNTLVGVGINNYQIATLEIDTNRTGSHSHSPYTTVLAERGILGSLLYWPLFYYPLLSLSREIKRVHSINIKMCGVILFTMLVGVNFSFLFYEYFNFLVWIILGFIFGLVSYIRDEFK